MVHDGKVDDFNLSLDDYPKWLADARRQDMAATVSTTGKSTDKRERKRQQAAQRKRLQPLRNALNKAEKLMEQLHEKQSGMETRLADPAIYEAQNRDQLKHLLKEKAQLDAACEAQELVWMACSEALESDG